MENSSNRFKSLQMVCAKHQFTYGKASDKQVINVLDKPEIETLANALQQEHFGAAPTTISVTGDQFTSKLDARKNVTLGYQKKQEIARINGKLQTKAIAWDLNASSGKCNASVVTLQDIRANEFVSRIGGRLVLKTIDELEEGNGHCLAAIESDEIFEFYTLREKEKSAFKDGIVFSLDTIYPSRTRTGYVPPPIATGRRRGRDKEPDDDEDGQKKADNVKSRVPVAINIGSFLQYENGDYPGNVKVRVAKEKKSNSTQMELIVYLVSTREIKDGEELRLEKFWKPKQITKPITPKPQSPHPVEPMETENPIFQFEFHSDVPKPHSEIDESPMEVDDQPTSLPQTKTPEPVPIFPQTTPPTKLSPTKAKETVPAKQKIIDHAAHIAKEPSNARQQQRISRTTAIPVEDFYPPPFEMIPYRKSHAKAESGDNEVSSFLKKAQLWKGMFRPRQKNLTRATTPVSVEEVTSSVRHVKRYPITQQAKNPSAGQILTPIPPGTKTLYKEGIVVYQRSLHLTVEELVDFCREHGMSRRRTMKIKIIATHELARRHGHEILEFTAEMKVLKDFIAQFYDLENVEVQDNQSNNQFEAFCNGFKDRVAQKILKGEADGGVLAVLFFPIVMSGLDYMLYGDEHFTNLTNVFNEIFSPTEESIQFIVPKVLLLSSTGISVPRSRDGNKLNVIRFAPVPSGNALYNAAPVVRLEEEMIKTIKQNEESGKVNLMTTGRTLLKHLNSEIQTTLSSCENICIPSIAFAGSSTDIILDIQRSIETAIGVVSADELQGIAVEFVYSQVTFLNENRPILDTLTDTLIGLMKFERFGGPIVCTSQSRFQATIEAASQLANDSGKSAMLLIFSTEGDADGVKFFDGANYLEYNEIVKTVVDNAPNLEILIMISNHSGGLVGFKSVNLSKLPEKKLAVIPRVAKWSCLRLAEPGMLLGKVFERGTTTPAFYKCCPMVHFAPYLLKQQRKKSHSCYAEYPELVREYAMMEAVMGHKRFHYGFHDYDVDCSTFRFRGKCKWMDTTLKLRNRPAFETSVLFQDAGKPLLEESNRRAVILEPKKNNQTNEDTKNTESEKAQNEEPHFIETDDEPMQFEIITPHFNEFITIPTDGIPVIPDSTAMELSRIMGSNQLAKIANVDDVLVTDLSSLKPKSEITDRIVASYSMLINAYRRDVLKKKDTFFVDPLICVKIRSENMENIDAILKTFFKKFEVGTQTTIVFPTVYMDQNYRHWNLSVLNTQSMLLTTFDSLGYKNQQAQKILINFLHKAHHKLIGAFNGPILMNYEDCPIQRRGTQDCGVILCQIMKYLFLLDRLPPKNIVFYSKEIRQLMTFEICAQTLVLPD